MMITWINLISTRTELASFLHFLRQVIYKAQILVNYYILNYPGNLSNDLFEQNFWYTICRLVYGNITIDHVQNIYPRLANISTAFNELQKMDNINLLVERNNLVGYGHVISSACETVATSYSNFYVENHEKYVANYFIYRLKMLYTVSNEI